MLRVEEKHLGKKARCPKCGGVVMLTPPGASGTEKTSTPVCETARPQTPDAACPSAAESSAAPPLSGAESPAPSAQPAAPAPVTAQAILAGIQGEFPPKKPSPMYHLGILVSAAIMVLLPVLYIGLICLVCYGVYYHALHDTAILEGSRGRASVYALGAYLAPIIVGGNLIFFMLKPLFARSAKPVATRSLTPKSDPLLFAFVQRLCAAVRAPMPKRIDIDNQVNASASFRQGWGSVLAGNDLVLTIGAPLAAGLSVRQLAGVLAHEFGHFSQGTGMRLTFVVRSINFWFSRVVYERDEWDVRLEQTAKSVDLRIGIFLHLARLMIWLTRRILFVLMWIGHGASCFTLRQMEFDADQYEIWLAGSRAFEATARRLHVLGAASQGAFADLGQFYQEGRLGDNLPKLILANISQMPEEFLQALNTSIDASKTGFFDTHPADADRIAAARDARSEGVFRLEAPASVLFSDFETLCRNVTIDFYRQIFGKKADLSQIHSVDHLLARQKKDTDAAGSLQRAFAGTFSVLRPAPFTLETNPCEDPKAAFARLQKI